MKDRTLEEIDEMVILARLLNFASTNHRIQFEQRLPARKFRTYKCVGSAAMNTQCNNADDMDDKARKEASLDSEKVATEEIERIA